MNATITHFIAEGADESVKITTVPLGAAANTHFALRKIGEHLTASQIPKGTYDTVITIHHETTNKGSQEGIK
jgi:hypothetical protein